MVTSLDPPRTQNPHPPPTPHTPTFHITLLRTPVSTQNIRTSASVMYVSIRQHSHRDITAKRQVYGASHRE